jgi:hypothetical protein
MNLIASLAVLAASFALLFFIRGRHGDALPTFQKSPWIVGQLFAMTILYLFFGGLMGVAVNLNWLH